MPTISVEHIELDDHGVARIAGSRSRVVNIVLDTRSGMTPYDIRRQYPHLSLAQIHAALAYYYDHQTELDANIERELQEISALRAETSGMSREALLDRMGGVPPKSSEQV